MRKKKIALIVILISLIVLCSLLAYYVFSKRISVSYDINEWNDLESSFSFLPSVEEMGDYRELEFKHQHTDNFIFQSDAYILKVTYSKEAFDTQKDVLVNRFSFQESVVDYGEETIEKTANFMVDDFQFHMLSAEKYPLSYPMRLVFVGVSEKSNEIAFIFFEDMDLDYIDVSFETFLVEECGWE